ncbi:hypothetical protein [Gandjariella thermophila]|uniref:Uncharacterized protein n=1 Tax=Gandjariella thermophila TaxID=1931992 RepID=A0A4D4IZQ9_9PSEU|nr:hypothetical protein [Gandjariella thermophila]GDY29825.1 hypothetical protein GTS_14580 [Gandjariella thermophila]
MVKYRTRLEREHIELLPTREALGAGLVNVTIAPIIQIGPQFNVAFVLFGGTINEHNVLSQHGDPEL